MFSTLRDSQCSQCYAELPHGSVLLVENSEPLCLTCADLDHLVYVPRGDPARSRRARKHSILFAMVVEFSRTRKRYERQGILVEEAALKKAQEECVCDAEVRAYRGERDGPPPKNEHGAREFGPDQMSDNMAGREASAMTDTAPVGNATPLVLQEDTRDRRAWRRGEISPHDWLVPLPQRCIEELNVVARRVREDPLPTTLLSPDQFPLAACAEAMGRVREKIRAGIGLAVLDRVPVERYAPEENQALAWLLGSLLGRLVAQKWNGAMLYDVRDTGQALGYGVRRSVTNLDLTFHTDGPWLELPPEVVGLYCINSAAEGGVSRFVSLCTVHNELRHRHSDLLPRLYRPFPWDRQAEHAPDDTKTLRCPIFHFDGQTLLARFNEKLISSGADLAGDPLDGEGQEALEVMRSIVDSPGLGVEFAVERGQVQFINNRQFAHSRTNFKDAPEPHLKRHMIRLWTREEGRRTFHA